MKIALVGGTHGNEPVGVEVIKHLSSSSKKYKNEFQTFWGSPKAYELNKRYVDTDLNRAFGKNQKRAGYEKTRAEELEKEIQDNFDFCIDLHTTTSNMGSTIILNNTHKWTKKASAYVQSKIPNLKLIVEDKLNEECSHLNRLAPGGVTIELGPVANNVIAADILLPMLQIVELILNFDFNSEVNLSAVEYYQMLGQIDFPNEQGWYIHPDLDRNDFKALSPSQPTFIDMSGNLKKYDGESEIFPFFINEAAYLENSSAFLIAHKKKGL